MKKYIRTCRQESKVTALTENGNVDIVMLDDLEVSVVDHQQAVDELGWYGKDYEDTLRIENSFVKDKSITVSSREHESTAWTILSFTQLDDN